MLKFGDGYAR
jgi:coiled-coil domain-containing protein 63/114